jgi:uncharacterized membrane protein YqaE (UPF0057 family)
MDTETKKDLIKLAIAILVPLGVWLGLGAPVTHDALAILGASIVGSVVAFLQGIIGGIQGLLRKFRKPKTPTPTPQ